jgi:hypothetical protein
MGEINYSPSTGWKSMSENVSHPHIVKLDLKQCPFCASQDVHTLVIQKEPPPGAYWDFPDKNREYVITCPNCGARGPNEPTINRAMDMWNMRRTEMPAPYVTDKEKP